MTKAEEIKGHQYGVEAMAVFYWLRSKLAIKDLYSDCHTIKDGDFRPNPDVELRHMDIAITDEDIDKMMNYKPSPSPDPDTLSMEIWSNVYRVIFSIGHKF